ncbi:neuraminidase-like domain-containing protein, partial [Bacillus cereus]|uniref:neuraminidase-like domain-containing protein n=1 Tax=Bacillus cereus TaxID=1396 RepID=UPI0020D273DC
MSNSTILQYIKEARRDVLVEHYIANNVPKDLTDKITNAESLYEYLLLDTKVSELVKTSPIAEAISSVQLYINRCIEGYEGELTAKSKSHFTQGNFLHNWDAYNKRYTTWAGKERLKYYAGSYIDPSLRYNKTGLFKRLEQNISQGRITEESIKNALQNYLTEYEILANLEYISVNKGDDESVLFFVGRTRTMPYEYFWRRLILKRNNKNNLVPAIWSEWKKITANIVEAVDNYVAPYWDKNNLHMQWCSIEKIQSDDEKYIEKQYINDWIMDGSGGWSPFKKFIPYNESFEYSRDNGWFNNPIKKEYIIYDGNQVLCNDPKEYNVNLTALPSHRTNVNFVASYQRYSAILAQGPYDSIVLNESEQEELSIPLNNSVSIRSLVGPPEKIAELKEVLNKQREMKKQLNEFLNGFPDELANLVVVFLDWLLFYLASKPKLFEGLKRLEALLNEIKKQGGIEELKDFKKFINKLAESIKRENLKELEDLKHPINKPIESIKNENLKELEYLKQLINKLDEIINKGHIEELEKLLKKMKEEFLNQEYLDESINKLLKIVSLTYYLLNHLEEKTEGLESYEFLMELIDVLNVIKNEDNTEEEVLIILEEAIDIFINYLFSYLFITHLIIPKHLEDLKRLIINLEEFLNQEYLERIINQENFEESIKQLLKVVSLTYYILNYSEENTEKLKCLEEIINELNELKKQENPEEVLDRLEIMIVRYLLYLLYYLENNPEKLKDLNRFIDKLEGVINQENPEVILILYKLGGILFRLEETIKIREKKEEILRNLVKSSTRHVYLGQTSLYMYGAIFDKQFKPPLGSSIKDPIHLSIKNNIDLSAVLQKSIDTLFDFSIQDDKQLGGIESFSGPYGLYLWEIFF